MNQCTKFFIQENHFENVLFKIFSVVLKYFLVISISFSGTDFRVISISFNGTGSDYLLFMQLNV